MTNPTHQLLKTCEKHSAAHCFRADNSPTLPQYDPQIQILNQPDKKNTTLNYYS